MGAALACRVGRHDWSDWELFSYWDKCELRATCRRDGCDQHRHRGLRAHDFEPVPAGDPCSMQQACARCGFTTRQDNHALGAWAAPDPARPCEQVRKCAGCDHTEERANHFWPPAVTYSERTEDGWIDYMVCKRCPGTRSRRMYRSGQRRFGYHDRRAGRG